jgi:hypothetical protein
MAAPAAYQQRAAAKWRKSMWRKMAKINVVMAISQRHGEMKMKRRRNGEGVIGVKANERNGIKSCEKQRWKT